MNNSVNVAMLKIIGVTSAASYVIIGLGMSALEGISRLGILSALIGIVAVALSLREIPLYLARIVPVFFVISSSWLWASGAEVEILGNYVSSVLGAILISSCIYLGWLRIEWVIAVLLVPGAINVYAYIVGDNYTSIVHGIDYEAAMRRFSGYIGHPSPFVTRLVCPLALLVIFWRLINIRIGYKLALTFMSIGCAVFAVSVSGSKKSLALIAPLLVVLIYYYVRSNNMSPIRLLVFGLLLSFSYPLFSVFSDSVGIEEIEVYNRLLMSVTAEDDSTVDRLSLLSLAPSLFMDSPLWGHGLDQFAVVSGAGYYSHNNFIELAVNVGIIGLFLYYYIVSITLKDILILNGYFYVIAIILLLLVLDFTGITYSDRGSQIILCSLILCGTMKT